MADNVDVNKLRKRKKRIKKTQHGMFFLIIFAIIASLYLNRSLWIDKLQGIGSKYSTIKQNDSTLAEGNFPLTIQGSGDFQIKTASDRLFILNDDTLYEYSKEGKLEKSWEHNLSNAVMQASGDRVLLYEEGSTKFRMYNKSGKVYEDELTNSILFGNVNSSGYAVLVTESDTFCCSVYIFDADGNNIYQRDCLERVMDVSISSDNSGCFIGTLNSEDGEINTNIIYGMFNSTEDVWQTEKTDSLCMNVYSDSSDNIYMIGDTYCNIYNKNGELVQNYIYQSDLVDYSFGSGKLILLLNDESRHKNKVVIFSSPDESPYENYFPNNLKSVYTQDSAVYLMSSEGVNEYKTDGTEVSSITLDDAYNSFIRLDKYIFLIGYDEINRVDFKD